MKEIEKIIKAYEATDWNKEKAALGTVVKVEESAYRRIGARMYVSSLGHWTGGISGGCLEGDALKRAQIAINNNQSSIIVYDTMDDDSHQIGVGLGCNGRIEVLFTPVNPENKKNPIEYLKSIVDTRKTEVLLQVLSQRDTNRKTIGNFFQLDELDLLSKEMNISTQHVEQLIDATLQRRKSKVFSVTNDHQEHFELLVELIRPKIKLICVGDNYDVNAFAGIADELGWEIHVAGKVRKLNKEIFQLASSVCTYEQSVDITIDKQTAVVLMSHDYKTDYSLIQHFINTEVPYIGLLGPRKRMDKMQKELNEAGVDVNLSAHTNLFAPVGLDIGAESPEEIALSISAEIIKTLRGRDGGALRERSGPIHERD